MGYSEELKKLYKAISLGVDDVLKFYDTLILTYQNSPDSLVEFSFQVLETAEEKTGYTAIYRAGFIIEELATAKYLQRLKQVRQTLPALKGLRDYRVDFDMYIELLKALEKENCRCEVYSNYNTSPSNKSFKIINSQSNQEDYTTETTAKCIHCGVQYLIETSIDYHYPVNRWRKL